MKVLEVLAPAKMEFEVVFRTGTVSKTTQRFNQITIDKCKVLSLSEKTRAKRLEVGSTLTTKFKSEDGITIVSVTRTK